MSGVTETIDMEHITKGYQVKPKKRLLIFYSGADPEIGHVGGAELWSIFFCIKMKKLRMQKAQK